MIDTSFDFRTDATGGDPDTYSPTLRQYHRLLWSKPLPSGVVFELDETTPGVYLHHDSELIGQFLLSSDSAVATFTGWLAMQPIVSQLTDAEREEFLAVGYTIGGMLVFPGNKIDGKQTINGARGFHPAIADRLDLTLECIRRHYSCEENKLGETLKRYGEFFALFGDFRGYVEFFLLQDLVAPDTSHVKFLLPFDDFQGPAVPRDIESYREYRKLTMEFVAARNRRIQQWVVGHQN